MKRIRVSYIYLAIFILIIAVTGIVSATKLARFYMFNEVDYNEWTVELGNRYETDISTCFWGKFNYVNFNGAVRRLLGIREMNDVVKMNNGYLLTTQRYLEDDYLQINVERISALDRYLQNRGTNFVYALSPYTSSKYDPQLPDGVKDYGNDNGDRLLQMLAEQGIDTIDFRKAMKEDGIDHYQMMYRTDHHWTTCGGLYAYGVLADYISSKTGCTLDERVADENQYTARNYEKWHLGSRGQRTGAYFAGIDDFVLYFPDFDNNVSKVNGGSGTMPEVVYDMSPLVDKDYTSRYTYDTVLDNTIGEFSNPNCGNDMRVMLVSDSYGKAVMPYLMLGFGSTVYVYDMQQMLTADYIEEYDPDVVIMLKYIEKGTLGPYEFEGF